MLTHAEAAILRGIHLIESATNERCLSNAFPNLDRHFCGEAPINWLTDSGKAALAEFDAHHVTVPRAAIQGLYNFCMALTCPDPVNEELDALEPFVGR